MNTQNPLQKATAGGPRGVPPGLVSTEAKLVYHSLDAAGAGTVDDLAGRLDLKKLTLYGVLDSLTRRGLVEKDGECYVPRTV